MKKILELKTPGWLISEEGANLIVAIASHMNKRLSSNVSSSTKNKNFDYIRKIYEKVERM